jgi:hypothetical protein
VRWDELFADLEREWRALGDAERQAEIAERTRAEFAQVRLVDRLRGSEGRHVRLTIREGRPVSGELTRVGADFALLAADRRETLVPLHAVGAVTGLGSAAVSEPEVGAVPARLGLGSVLRRIAADRSVVTLVGTDGVTRSGTVQRVGADFLELAEHVVDELPRARHTRGVVLVPLSALVLLRRESPRG